MAHQAKISEADLLGLLHTQAAGGEGSFRLPGSLRLWVLSSGNGRITPSGQWEKTAADAIVAINWPDGGSGEFWHFAVEAKARNTPEAIATAIAQVHHYASRLGDGFHPMILVPYLSDERLDELEMRGVSGIDACGNGVVMIPGKLYVRSGGKPNLYRGGRDLNNPFRGLSAMAGRMLLIQPRWNSLNEIHKAITDAGTNLSLSQVSKALKALREERIVSKTSKGIFLREPLQLLDLLGREWKPPADALTHACNVKPGTRFAEVFASLIQQMPDGTNLFQWAETGESSVGRHASFSESGPRKIAVTNLPLALQHLHHRITDPVAKNFADFIFIQTQESGYYFHNEVDYNGHLWADPLQTWLELQAGDARQRAAAIDLRDHILKRCEDKM